jgi:hypothetical protein
MEENYMSSLLGVAEAAPQAAVVYTDIQAFGDLDIRIHQLSITGEPLDRLATLLTNHFNAVAFRGLTRISALRDVEPISGNAFDDFAADTVWMTRLATVGDLVCVGRPLYRKRYHPGNTHFAWNRWPPGQDTASICSPRRSKWRRTALRETDWSRQHEFAFSKAAISR